jgi:hypothetical protein
MGVSFHSAGCIKFTEECWNESCAVNITAAPRHKDQRKTRRCRRAPFRGLIGRPSVARLCGLLRSALQRGSFDLQRETF